MRWIRAIRGLNLPHARGDEPLDRIIDDVADLICPTHVGMNRAAFFKDIYSTRVGMNWKKAPTRIIKA